MTTTEVLNERRTLRKHLLHQRRQIDLQQRQRWDQSLIDHLLAWCEEEKPASLAVYSPIQCEPDVGGCYSKISAMGIQIAFPLVVAKEMPLQFLAWKEGDPMTKDDFGIPVPLQRDHFVIPEVLLIPCVGFNSRNYRLGYGGGFYDRTLSQLPSAISIGIAYQNQHCEFEPGIHDVAMTKILTESSS
ncbi:5-formyltetrahydrofolate cyclo-ligase [Undibacterium sp. RuRC25W]|uniref:5-formyltetrahydrofolate cyclo-ligase n=1 Tax=Undibacterium sp. RuRC25W TaxID=3413047 RepID=UPI003BF2E172